jgi:hypothetical protein
MCTIHSTFVYRDDPSFSRVFDRDTLGFGVRSHVGHSGITVGPSDQPGTSIVLERIEAVPHPVQVLAAEEVLLDG